MPKLCYVCSVFVHEFIGLFLKKKSYLKLSCCYFTPPNSKEIRAALLALPPPYFHNNPVKQVNLREVTGSGISNDLHGTIGIRIQLLPIPPVIVPVSYPFWRKSHAIKPLKSIWQVICY